MKARNKIDNESGDCIFGVCNEFIGKRMDYFFTIFDKETASLGNETLLTALKEKIYTDKTF